MIFFYLKKKRKKKKKKKSKWKDELTPDIMIPPGDI